MVPSICGTGTEATDMSVVVWIHNASVVEDCCAAVVPRPVNDRDNIRGSLG